MTHLISGRTYDFLWLWAVFTGTVAGGYLLAYVAILGFARASLCMSPEFDLWFLAFSFLAICGFCEVLSMSCVVSDERRGCYRDFVC